MTSALQAIVLCGGKGTRLSSLYSDRPKILVPIAGRPFLEWQLEWLGKAGITDSHLAAGYKAEVLAAYAERVQGSGFRVLGLPVHFSISTEAVPLGTGGGLKFVEPWIRSDPFLVLNGDSISPNLDFGALVKAHGAAGSGRIGPAGAAETAATTCASRNPDASLGSDSSAPNVSGCSGVCSSAVDAGVDRVSLAQAAETAAATQAPHVTIAVSRIDEAGRYGTVEFNEDGQVTAFREKAQRDSGWINAGVYLIDHTILASIPPDRNISMETDVFPNLVKQGRLRACPIAAPMLDMGTPEGIEAMEDYLRGIVNSQGTYNLGTPPTHLHIGT